MTTHLEGGALEGYLELRSCGPATALKNTIFVYLFFGEKTDKGKSHKGIWRSDAPEASQGQTRDVPGTPGTFGPDLCVNQY